jgi:hypothetical protein
VPEHIPLPKGETSILSEPLTPARTLTDKPNPRRTLEV